MSYNLFLECAFKINLWSKNLKYLQSLLITLAVCGAVSCSLGSPGTYTLPNGTVISASERESLEALNAEAEAIFTSRLGEVRAKDISSGGCPDTTEDENFAIMEDLKSLIRSEFGPDADKYIIEGYFEEEADLSTPSMNGSRGFDVTTGIDAIYQYRLYMEAKYCILPWGSWNWAFSEHRAYYINTPVDRFTWYTDTVQNIRSMIKDEANPSGISVTKSQAASVTATGKPKYGLFPKIGNIVSEHEAWDENIAGGHVLRSFSWMMP
jgi:hypothetical protein